MLPPVVFVPNQSTVHATNPDFGHSSFGPVPCHTARLNTHPTPPPSAPPGEFCPCVSSRVYLLSVLTHTRAHSCRNACFPQAACTSTPWAGVDRHVWEPAGLSFAVTAWVPSSRVRRGASKTAAGWDLVCPRSFGVLASTVQPVQIYLSGHARRKGALSRRAEIYRKTRNPRAVMLKLV